MLKITSQLLRSKGACADQVALFEKLGGDEKELTRTLFLKHASKFDLGWAAVKLLSPTQKAEYERVHGPALAEYERVHGPAFAEYKRVHDLAKAEYVFGFGLALAEYKRVIGLAWVEYERVHGPAFAEYKRGRAIAFWQAIQED